MSKNNPKENFPKTSEVKSNIKKPQNPLVKRPTTSANKVNDFEIDSYAVYPSHGVGKVKGFEEIEVAGSKISCYLIEFEKERLLIKIPLNSVKAVGLRHLSSKKKMEEVTAILRGGIKKSKGVWSRKVQEYESKINSGCIDSTAEVVRDLTRDIEDSSRSFSERMIYEAAVYRLASEYAIVYEMLFEEAKAKIITIAKDKLMSETKALKDDDFDFDEDAEEEVEEEEEDEDDEM